MSSTPKDRGDRDPRDKDGEGGGGAGPASAEPHRVTLSDSIPGFLPADKRGNEDPSADDKRNEDRAAIQLKVDYKRLNTFFADYTKNISKGGTFIRTTRPLDVGTEFVFVLSVPSHGTQLALKGEVVWIVAEDKATPDNPAGMGIKFKFKNEGERREVDDVVEKLMDEALGKHISNRLLRRG